MIIVGGIARSGLTITMQMLHAGGYPCVGDAPAFEPFQVDMIPWEKCAGRAVKAVDIQLQFPPDGDYRVIMPFRDINEQAKSTIKFLKCVALVRLPISKKAMIRSIKSDYQKIHKWLKKEHDPLHIAFEDLILKPMDSAKKIRDWVGRDLDINRMARCVLPRSPGCYKTMLELSFI
jgi:hypothetical protein